MFSWNLHRPYIQRYIIYSEFIQSKWKTEYHQFNRLNISDDGKAYFIELQMCMWVYGIDIAMRENVLEFVDICSLTLHSQK